MRPKRISILVAGFLVTLWICLASSGCRCSCGAFLDGLDELEEAIEEDLLEQERQATQATDVAENQERTGLTLKQAEAPTDKLGALAAVRTAASKRIAKSSSKSIQETLEKAFVPNIRLRPYRVPMAEIPKGASRFAGQPNLPKGFKWPRYKGNPLVHLAQLNLQETAPWDLENRLPKTGWLVVFVAETEVAGYDPKHKGTGRVFHFQGKAEDLVRTRAPRSQGTQDWDEYVKPCRLVLSAGVDVPGYELLSEDFGLDICDDKGPCDDYHEFVYTLAGVSSGGFYHHLLGHAQAVQGEPRNEANLVVGGIYLGGDKPIDQKKVEQLKAGAKDWRLLLQIDSSSEKGPGWMWGDVGRLYFYIKDADLKAERFDKVWTIMQCH